ncbi:MAG: hypothetical protein K9H64_10190 [Bacteroidales bacterium]|nr:hypothetical protein [Bacteroidales bacterium]MCF8456237.1 hypothetical protein [Bacteroidales bacterium]
MQTYTVDILNQDAIRLLKDLEIMKLIRLHKSASDAKIEIAWSRKYKGAMEKQDLLDVENQLNELRNSWE